MNNQAQQTQTDERESLRQSFMRLALPWRLGELATSLSSVRSVIEQDGQQKTVRFYLDESTHFIKWLTPDSQPAWQADLTSLKQVLSDWLANWPAIWENAEQRAAIAVQASIWSDKFLQHSGLLDPEINPR
jgi:hypothetical protein